ncbi:MAG: iron-only hydrogenase system regulator [Peptococcaceae bacterium]|nr:iron-only hydrogenase system regulator [Peptococcaceae bacterium]
MKKVAVISAILEDPEDTQHDFNDIVASFKGIIKGRMGIPIPEQGISLVSIAVLGETDEINSLTGKLGKIDKVSVKTAMSKKDF